MPELPEVETTRRGLLPLLVGRKVQDMTIRQRNLRWPISRSLPAAIRGQSVQSLDRRAKYLLMRFSHGSVLLHLGMSGSLRILPQTEAPKKHDHVDFVLADKQCLRLHDPRRFGAILWTTRDPQSHPLLKDLGPEPLDEEFDGDYLFRRSRGRKVAIKNFLMNSQVVVGVGNIYANEALFQAGIRPTHAAGRLSKLRLHSLATKVKNVLQHALEVGGTTLRDYRSPNGHPGYFRLELAVYGRAGEPCKVCRKPLIEKRIGQRSSVYCRTCQS